MVLAVRAAAGRNVDFDESRQRCYQINLPEQGVADLPLGNMAGPPNHERHPRRAFEQRVLAAAIRPIGNMIAELPFAPSA